MTHRIGIIGLGTVGSRFVEQFNHHPEFDLVAAWDPDASACTEHQDAVSIANDAAGVIASADAVYIAVPPLFHGGYVEACIEARTAVFCEKPLGINIAESRALVNLVENSGLPAGVNFVFSAAPSATALQDSITAGEIGLVVRGELHLHFAQWPRAWHTKATWLRMRDQGGWIREVASHFLFLANRVLGPLDLETSTVTFADGPDGDLCETEAFAHFDSNGTSLTMTGTSGGVGPDIVDFTIRGTERSIRILDWYRLQSSNGDTWTDYVSEKRSTLGSDPYQTQLGQLSLMLNGKSSSIATFAEALAVQELVEATLSQG